MPKLVRFCFFIAFIFVFTGCATILKKKSIDVNINSEPQGANVFLNGNRVGKTPLTLNISHRNQAILTFKKDGYEEITHIIDNHIVGGWMVVSLLCDGFPAIIDLATKNAYSLNENQVTIKLEPMQTNSNANK